MVVTAAAAATAGASRSGQRCPGSTGITAREGAARATDLVTDREEEEGEAGDPSGAAVQ